VHHNVRLHRTGSEKLHHAVVGDLDLNFEAMELPSDPGIPAQFMSPGGPGT
jgi:hypothetical protein